MAKHLKPRKYEDKGFNPSDAVDDWIAKQASPNDMRDDLLSTAYLYQNSIGKVYGYFVTRGCTASMFQIKAWMKKNGIKPGKNAESFNDEYSAYHGLNTNGVLEKFITKMAVVADRYLELIEESLDNGAISEAQIPVLLNTFPRVVSELKQMVNSIKHDRSQSTYRDLVQAGAARLKELIIAQVAGTPEYLWLADLVEGAMLQLQEDLNVIN